MRFSNFPNGCCLDTSRLLATYLKEKGFGEFFLLSSSINIDNQYITHALLKSKNGFIIDITASQFNMVKREIIFRKISIWHFKNFNPFDN